MAVEKTLSLLEVRRRVRVTLESDLKSGKGMGKSTADMTAAIYATALALKEEISLLEVERILLSIEPTDSTSLPNIGLFDHRRGRVSYLLPLPKTSFIKGEDFLYIITLSGGVRIV